MKNYFVAKSRRRIQQGAITSPILSNLIATHMDKRISALIKSCDQDASYTRYADDMTFSTRNKDTLFIFPELVSNIIKSLFGNRISINRSKFGLGIQQRCQLAPYFYKNVRMWFLNSATMPPSTIFL